jgi:hypothetical protein
MQTLCLNAAGPLMRVLVCAADPPQVRERERRYESVVRCFVASFLIPIVTALFSLSSLFPVSLEIAQNSKFKMPTF